jgi:hypothetical protein
MWHGLEARSTLRRASWRLTNFGGPCAFLAGVAGLSRSRPVLAGAAGPRHGRNYGTALTVTTGATISGAYGMSVRNLAGTGALTITANGDVTGTTGSGIVAKNSSAGTDLTVTTAAGTTVHGGSYGIDAYTLGSGALTINAQGNVTGKSNFNGLSISRGIFARNVGTALSVTTGAGTTVIGIEGIAANNFGAGAVTVTVNGDVTGIFGGGIDVSNSSAGTSLTVTTGVGTTVSGRYSGISALSDGTGALTITVNGNVTGTVRPGIYAQSSVGPISICIAATGTVSGAADYGIQAVGRPATVTVAGTVNGGASGAIQFDQTGAFANRLELVTGAAKSVTDPRSELGFRTDKSYAMQDGIFTLRGRLAWAHDDDTNRAIGATFQTLPGASFVVNGAAQAADSALVTASVEKKWLTGWSAAAAFEGEFSQVTTSYAGKRVVRYAW